MESRPVKANFCKDVSRSYLLNPFVPLESTGDPNVYFAAQNDRKMKVDKQKFDTLLDRLIKSDPQKRSETKPEKRLKPKKIARRG